MRKFSPCDKEPCYSQKIEEILVADEFLLEPILECEGCVFRLHLAIETITGTFSSLTENYVTSDQSDIYAAFNEELDISKMDMNIPNKPLPGYLKKFIRDDKPSKSENLSLLCVVSETIKVFDIFGKGLVEGFYPLAPSFRGTDTVLKYKVLEEDGEDIKFSYQFIKESDDLVYLTIQLFPKSEMKFQEVELSLDERLLISSKINEQGIVNFPNLQEGKYVLNFRGKNFVKSVDLTIYSE